MSRQYGTVQQLKRRLGIEESDTAQDDYLTDLLEGATAFIETYTRRVFSPAGQNVVITGEVHTLNYENTVVWLNNTDVVSVQAVRSGYTSPTTLDSTGYEVSALGRIRLFRYVDYLSIDYTIAGTGVPVDIQLAARLLATDVYHEDGVDQEQVGDYRVYYTKQAEGSPKTDKACQILDMYRIRGV